MKPYQLISQILIYLQRLLCFIIFSLLSSAQIMSLEVSKPENKGENRLAWTLHVAFVVALHCNLQIIFSSHERDFLFV